MPNFTWISCLFLFFFSFLLQNYSAFYFKYFWLFQCLLYANFALSRWFFVLSLLHCCHISINVISFGLNCRLFLGKQTESGNFICSKSFWGLSCSQAHIVAALRLHCCQTSLGFAFNYAFIVRAGHKSTTCQHHASISQSQIHKPSCANRASNPAPAFSAAFSPGFTPASSLAFSPVFPFCIQLKHADRTQSAERTYVTRYGKCFS